MISVLALSAVDRGFEPWSGQTKDYKIGICCYLAKHAALRRKSKDWLRPMLRIFLLRKPSMEILQFFCAAKHGLV
jgi:hypothetical protein